MTTPVAAHVRIEPTDAQLRAAWAKVRRANWPATFEAAMEDPVLSRIVRMTALHPAPRPVAAPAAPQPVATQTHRHAAPRYHAELQPGFVDFKRRASGERDDD